MKYNTKIPQEAQQAKERLDYLIEKEVLVEVIKVSPRRSLNQNNYLHLLIGAFGSHFGYSLEEAKIIYKELNPSVYKYDKKGRTFWKSSADLTKEEMAKTIDNFMKISAEHYYPLPPATDQEWLRQIENDIEKSKHYL